MIVQYIISDVLVVVGFLRSTSSVDQVCSKLSRH